MLDIKEALAKIYTSVEPAMKEAGMAGVRPEGVEKGEIPVVKGDNGVGYRFDFKGEASAVAVKHLDKKLTFELSTTVDADGNFTDYKEVSVSLLDAETLDKIVADTMVGGATLTKHLGTSAWYAPGAAAAQVVKAVLHNEKLLLPCSAMLEGEYGHSDVCVGVPVILGKEGIEKVVEIELNDEEKALFDASVAACKGTNAALEGALN